jgi:hypothetical protein
MVIFPLYIATNPLALALAALDAYVLTAVVYLCTNRLMHSSSLQWHPILRKIVTAPARAIENRLIRRRNQPLPSWQPWTVVSVAAVIVRQLLAALIVSTL